MILKPESLYSGPHLALSAAGGVEQGHSDISELIRKVFTEGFTNYKWFVKRLSVIIRLALFDDAFVVNMMVLLYMTVAGSPHTQYGLC